jgi:hypothetical protein
MIIKTVLRIVSGTIVVFAGWVWSDTVSVDYAKVKKAIDPLSFGMNSAYSVTEFQSENPGYIAALKYMTGTSLGNTGLIRLHQWGMLNSWTSNAWWDAGKVMRTIKSLKSNGFTVVVNIPDGPKGQFSTIDTNKIVKFCSDLVKIVNIDNKSKIKYWEVPNERDINAFKGMLEAEPLAAMVKRCRAEMKKVDSTILVGGPAFGDPPNLELMLKFVKAVVPDIDFISFHAYAVGNKQNASDAEIYDATQIKIANIVKTLRDTLSVLSPNKYIPIHCNEYNLTWDWTYVDPRLHTNKMAVFVALTMFEMIRNGGDITNIWNEKENAFGMMDQSNQPYLPGHLFHLVNTFFMGNMVESAETNSKNVFAFASCDSETRSILLINRSGSKQDVSVNVNGLPSGMIMKRYEVWTSIDSSKTVTISEIGKRISLPDNSVTILTGKSPVSAVKPSRHTVSITKENGPVLFSVHTLSGRLVGTYCATTDRLSKTAISQLVRTGSTKVIPSGVYVVSVSGVNGQRSGRYSLTF